ncbi:helix-turn-helix transcriptional regulator [Kordiimonas sp. SCSIO 12603]|uniref:ArsR/SmtB family transcription factor n=1 Tax=Kordiimonas sp. SCSIO 12603 TaxID=2829596 RepID=UPI0021024EBF|nr:metalloregulator ArsR/SmtB family transcription factor [Kordiimonas sp. SCSIO 12603]UTW57296.1 helix-turn-helix transcriptional regulator [Kordiimonas sp. SCSIO 12603]
MENEQLDLIFKALSDGTRRRIIERLSVQSEQSLFEVCAASIPEDGVALSRQTISQHLRVLQEAGLIKTSWKGRTKAHSLNEEAKHKDAIEWLKKYIGSGEGK